MKKPRTLMVLSVVALVSASVGISTVTGRRQAQGETIELQATANSSSLEQRIAQEKELVRAGEKEGIDSLSIGRLWVKLASDYEDARAYVESEDAYNHALKLFGASPEGAKDYAIALDNLGSLYLIKGELKTAEEIRKRSMALREAAGNKLEIARGRAHLAEVAFARHKYKEAEEQSAEAYRLMVEVNDPSADDFVFDLILLTYASSVNREYLDAVAHGTDALSRARAAFAANSMQVGLAHMALGYAEWKAEIRDGPDEEMRQGIEILKAQAPQGNTHYLHGSLEQYRAYLEAVHRKPEARQVAVEEAQLKKQSGKCANCTVSVYGLDHRP